MASTGSLIPIHYHDNKDIIDLFSETEDQILLYRGRAIAEVSEFNIFKNNFNLLLNRYNIHETDTVIHVTQADKDFWNTTLNNAKQYAKGLFDQVTSFVIRKVDTLPTEDINPMCIYFLRSTDPLRDNMWDEYMYIDGQWEIIGSIGVDFDVLLRPYLKIQDFTDFMQSYYTKSAINTILLDYYTQDEIDNMFTYYYTKTEIDTTLSNYYTSSEIDTLLANIQSDVDAIHTHDNKEILDKLDIDEDSHLMYDGEILTDYFTEYDVKLLMAFLWGEPPTNFISSEGKYIATTDGYVLSGRE